MPITKQGEVLSNHFENGEWEAARVLIQRIVNVQTLVKSGWEQVWNLPEIPPTLISSLLMRIKAISKIQNKLYPVGLYPYMYQGKSGEFWRDASVSTCKAFLQALTDTYRGGITVKWPERAQLQSEINTLWNNYLGLPTSYSAQRRLEGNEEHKQAVLSIHSLQDLDQNPELKSMWQKTELLLKAALGRNLDDNEEEEWLVLHAIAEVDCLSIVMWFALRMYPQQIRTRDENGNLPLHIAVTKPIFAQQYFVGIHEARYHHFRDVYPQEFEEAQEFMAVFLLSQYPEGATYMDANKHVPLIVSLLTLTSQNVIKTPNDYYIHSDQQLRHRLRKLIDAAPAALVSRDLETRLYPFQTAASVDAPLDSIYTLFRSDPSALKYRRITKREADYERLLKENEELRSVLQDKDRLLKELQAKLEQYQQGKKRAECGGRRKRCRKEAQR